MVEACAGALPIAVQVYRGNDLTTSRPAHVIGNAVWLTTQLRTRGLHVCEVDGDYWRILTCRQTAGHLMHALGTLGLCQHGWHHQDRCLKATSFTGYAGHTHTPWHP